MAGSILRRIAVVAAVAIAAPSGLSLADAHAGPGGRAAEVIVQFHAGTPAGDQRRAVRAAGGEVIRDLHVIDALGARLPVGGASRLARTPGVRAVTPNAAVHPAGHSTGRRWGSWNPGALATAYVQSTRTDMAWTELRAPATGKGVAVAVIDTGIAGELPDFRRSAEDTTSRVIASVVTNPDATTATDRYGHGTHVAGLVAGNGRALPPAHPLYNRYVGTAPEADLVSVKVSDDRGNASIIDVIAGLQFVVDHGDAYGIRVANLSLGSSLALPYHIDPLNAAVEAVWAHGVVVVVAAGNRGTAPDAVSYAPANDPYVITVGAVDDQGTKNTEDDRLTSWSSRGVTQDGFAKPEIVAPGAHIVGPLAPDSDFRSLCEDCVVDERYFQLSGTSMAAPIVAGIAADVISQHPGWTPDEVKGALTFAGGTGGSSSSANVRRTSDGVWEVAADRAVDASERELASNRNLALNSFLDPLTGQIDYARASWRRASWKAAIDELRASWKSTSWTCDCAEAYATADTTRASWGRASWGRASWRGFFGDSPSEFGELGGGKSGAARPRGRGPAN